MIRCTLILHLLFSIIALPSAAQSSLASPYNQNRARARSSQQAEAFIQQGIDALERNDASGARSFFERALQIDPKNVAAHSYLGIQADREGRLEDAERHFAAAAAHAPQSPSARNNYGAILLRLNRTERAASEFEASLKLDPSQASALVNLGQIRFAGQTERSLREARGLFERAQAISPDLSIARALVVIDLRLNDVQRAAANYRSYKTVLDSSGPVSTAVAPASARAELGGALLAAGLREEAVAELSAAVQSEPSNVNYIIQLARAYMERKEIASAGRTLESAVARGIDAAPVYAALAEVY
ncbi:MAG TPA: tetratricopeptide repeat protein, partial [Blastocatellia bacterium]|nr:tetratricopeptide repeat protein [Blastocatellia bacterium]